MCGGSSASRVLFRAHDQHRSWVPHRIVWLVVLEMHDPLAAFIFEEVTGIWPDFMLLITSWYLFATAKTATSNDVRTKTVYFNWGLGASWCVCHGGVRQTQHA